MHSVGFTDGENGVHLIFECAFFMLSFLYSSILFVLFVGSSVVDVFFSYARNGIYMYNVISTWPRLLQSLCQNWQVASSVERAPSTAVELYGLS